MTKGHDLPVRAIFDEAVRAGVRPDMLRGASQDEIERARVGQKVSQVPQAVREIWGLLGLEHGPFWAGDRTHIDVLDGESKQMAINCHAETGGGLVDPAGMLVLLQHSADDFHVIDGQDLLVPDPSVWLIRYGALPAKRWASTTEWFRTAVTDVLRMKARIERLRVTGGSSSRHKYFSWPS